MFGYLRVPSATTRSRTTDNRPAGNNVVTDSHPLPAHTELPWFVTPPGNTNVLLVAAGVFLVIFVLLFGVLMLRLHHLPEHIAQKEQKVQYQLVAVLGLIAMFTHENLFWIAGLLLAMIDIPNFSGLFGQIARSVERIARTKQADNSSSKGAERAHD